MEFERSFEALPEQVFSAFLSELERVGQLDGVGGFGTAATFRIAHTRLHPAPTLLAQVRPVGTSTVLHVRESHNGEWRTLQDDHHLAHLSQLLDGVAHRLSRVPEL